MKRDYYKKNKSDLIKQIDKLKDELEALENKFLNEPPALRKATNEDVKHGVVIWQVNDVDPYYLSTVDIPMGDGFFRCKDGERRFIHEGCFVEV